MKTQGYRTIAIASAISLLNCLPLTDLLSQPADAQTFPGRRVGGGTRGESCVQNSPIPLTALVPETNLGLTTEAYPQFFWFMPKVSARMAEFTLYDVDEDLLNRKLIYKTIMPISATGGVKSLQLAPQNQIPPLNVGQTYRWSIAVICNPRNRESDLVVDGWIRRVKPETGMIQGLAKSGLRDRAIAFARNGIWYDALTAVSQLQCTNPNDKVWGNLLESVGLVEVGQQSLAQVCRK